MTSEAAKTVKFGFWVAVGFWAFAVVAALILMISLRALAA